MVIVKSMSRRIMPFGICALLLLAGPLRAAEPARIPYEFIYQVQQREAALTRTYTNLIMYLRLKSSLPEVKTGDLKIYIDSKGGRIPVTLDTNGTFAVPMLESLLEEKAWLVSNQPKGTMNFNWYVGLVVSEVPTNGIHYGSLMRPLKDLEVIRSQMVPGLASPTNQALRLKYAKDKEGIVVIHAKSGDKVYKTDAAHTVAIPWEPALLEEDPEISIPIPPEKVDVVTEE
jgi:hypothetical protein